MSIKCTPGFACCAFSDTTLVCFIVNEHTTKCSHYRIQICNNMQLYVQWHNKSYAKLLVTHSFIGLVSCDTYALSLSCLRVVVMPRLCFCTHDYLRVSEVSDTPVVSFPKLRDATLIRVLQYIWIGSTAYPCNMSSSLQLIWLQDSSQTWLWSWCINGITLSTDRYHRLKLR